jgi:hypothetical protein
MRVRTAPAVGWLVLAITIAGCTAFSPSTPGTPLVSMPPGFPVGVWSTTITEADLRDAGIEGPGEIRENSGVFTHTFNADGTWTAVQEADVPIRWPIFRGTWTPTGPNSFDMVTTFPPDYAGDVVGITWERAGDTLRLRVPEPPDPLLPVILETHPWTPAG